MIFEIIIIILLISLFVFAFRLYKKITNEMLKAINKLDVDGEYRKLAAAELKKSAEYNSAKTAHQKALLKWREKGRKKRD